MSTGWLSANRFKSKLCKIGHNSMAREKALRKVARRNMGKKGLEKRKGKKPMIKKTVKIIRMMMSLTKRRNKSLIIVR